MNDKTDDVGFFLYDMERGKSKYHSSAPYHNEEELYDYLVENEKDESE